LTHPTKYAILNVPTLIGTRRKNMININKISPLKAISTREAKKRFTEINRIVAEEDSAVVVTRRGSPSTAIISVKLLRKLIGDEAFKEMLFDEFLARELESRVDKLLNGKEGTVSFDELKKKLGW